MKKIILSFLVISALFFRINVFAEDKSQIELIPINTNGSVDTEKFLYQNISFNNNIIKFDSITNKSNVKDFVSINVLLFDKDDLFLLFFVYFIIIKKILVLFHIVQKGIMIVNLLVESLVQMRLFLFL